MDLRRLRPADWLTGLAGVALLVLLFLPWYGTRDGSLTGWEAFGFMDIWFAITGVLAIAVWLLTAMRDTPSVPVASDVLCATAATIALVLAIVRLADVPHDAIVTGRDWGLYAGALAVLGIFAGSWWAMRDESAPGLRPPPEARTLPAPPRATAEHEPTPTET